MDGKYIKAAFKIFLIVLLAGFLMQAISFGIYYYKWRNFEKRSDIKGERERCEKVVSDPRGDLSDFSYCKSFLEWLRLNTPQR